MVEHRHSWCYDVLIIIPTSPFQSMRVKSWPPEHSLYHSINIHHQLNSRSLQSLLDVFLGRNMCQSIRIGGGLHSFYLPRSSLANVFQLMCLMNSCRVNGDGTGSQFITFAVSTIWQRTGTNWLMSVANGCVVWFDGSNEQRTSERWRVTSPSPATFTAYPFFWWIARLDEYLILESAACSPLLQVSLFKCRPWNLGRGHSSCCIAIPLRRMTTPSLIFSPLHSKGLDCNSVATLDLISWADYFIDSISPFLSKMKDRPISQTMGVIYHQNLAYGADPFNVHLNKSTLRRVGVWKTVGLELQWWSGLKYCERGVHCQRAEDLDERLLVLRLTMRGNVWKFYVLGSDAIWLQVTLDRGKKWMKSWRCGGRPLVLKATSTWKNKKKSHRRRNQLLFSSNVFDYTWRPLIIFLFDRSRNR